MVCLLAIIAKLSPGATWVYGSMLATAAEDCGRVTAVTQLEQLHQLCQLTILNHVVMGGCSPLGAWISARGFYCQQPQVFDRVDKIINCISVDHYRKHVMIFIGKITDIWKTVSLWSHGDGLTYLSLTFLTVMFLITLSVKILVMEIISLNFLKTSSVVKTCVSRLLAHTNTHTL